MPGAQRKAESLSPAARYTAKIEQLEQEQQREKRLETRLAIAKLVLFFLCVVAAVVLLLHGSLIAWIAAPTALLAVLIVLHEKLLLRLRTRARRIDFYLRGLDRLKDKWAGKGEGGERFLEEKHPYARDLDLFGKGSLFELLCTARTRGGEELLAAWLLNGADREEILSRQEAIAELKEGVEARESLFLLGEEVRAGVHPETLSRWGEKQSIFPDRWVRTTTGVLALLWLAAMVWWAVSQHGAAAGWMTVCNLLWAKRIFAHAEEATDQIEQAAADLKLLAGVLEHCESRRFTARRLVGLQDALRREGVAPSVAIARLQRIADALESRRNLLLRVPDLTLFWSVQLIFAAEKWQRQFGAEIRGWLRAVAEFEALTALSAYAYEHGDDPFPEIVESSGGAVFVAEGMTHPLLPSARAVRNDLSLGPDRQLIILSGPNMAGKSTFIRSVGVNAVLALCGAPVRARRLRISELQVTASICILDSLAGGISRFYAEIHRVKLISDLARGSRPVLFLLDELLSGTNSHDRLAGTEYVVRSLLGSAAIGIVSTHDLALTRIPDALDGRAANFHFEDRLEAGKMLFDYTLKPGVVETSNALELMRLIGLGI